MKTARSTVWGGLALLMAGTPASAQFSGYYRLMARHSGKAVAVQGASTANAANVFQWTYGGALANDEWQLVDLANGYHRVVNRHSGKVLNVGGASTANGANVDQWGWANVNQQMWQIVDLGSGYHRFTARHSGKVLNVAGAGTGDGANVDQWGWSNVSQQMFQVVALSAGATPTATPTPTPPTATPTRTPTPTPGSPTNGWTQASWTYRIHKPWNLAVSDRFSYSNGEWRLWVYSTDASHAQGNTTAPRTEMRWDIDYTSGQRMFDGDVYIPSPTSGVCFQQVFGGSSSATSNMTLIRNGTVTHYNDAVIRSNGWDNWWNLKVAHDANNNIIRIYDNNVLKFTGADHGDATHYFKNGVYTNTSPSSRMESRWRNLRLWRR